jgi:hypothetical protein
MRQILHCGKKGLKPQTVVTASSEKAHPMMLKSGEMTNPVARSVVIHFEQRKVYEKAVSLMKVPLGIGSMEKSPVVTAGLV